MRVPESLDGQIADLYFQVADMKRRERNRKRTGKVVEVDHEKGKYRVELKSENGDYPPYKTGWIRLAETRMGAIKTHAPVSEGEQVVVKSESGDLADAEIVGSLPSNDQQRPSTDADTYVLKIGSCEFKITGSAVTITAPKIDFVKA